ncbi:MAG TPA: anti-sigma factor [Acidimicrobiia bacterium]|nr:anti-sigma factor [Acidimicrobiia bacterium]
MTARDDVESLLGAYALDALSFEERRRVEAALAADPSLEESATIDLAVAAALAEGSVEAGDRASAALWKRIETATRPLPGKQSARYSPRWRRWLGAVAAATALAALVGLAVVVARQLGDISRFRDTPLAVAADDARGQPGTRVVSLEGEVPAEVVLAADGTGYLLTPEAPALPSDRTYQLWAIVGEQVISAGVLGPTPEVAAFHVTGDVAGFALTVEVAGGVVSSQQEPVAVGLIQG